MAWGETAQEVTSAAAIAAAAAPDRTVHGFEVKQIADCQL